MSESSATMTMLQYREEKSKPTAPLILMAIATMLLMMRSHRILYVRHIPEELFYGFALFAYGVYFIANYRELQRLTLFTLISTFLIAFIYFYERLIVSTFKISSMLSLVSVLMGSYILISCPLRDKLYTYRVFMWSVVGIVSVALVAWILYLLGVPLPYYNDYSDNFYKYQIYYVFNINLSNYDFNMILPRFAGPFLEPGHLATIAIFMLFINRFDLRRIENIVLLLAVLFSLSLAGYGLLVGAVLITLFNNRKFIAMLSIGVAFVLIGIASQYFNNGDNPVYQLVVSRLELNENGDDIVGNNRSTGFFDLTYQKYLKTDKVWTGMGKRAFGKDSKGSGNVTLGTAGYQRYFFVRGIIGTAAICIFLLFYWLRYFNRWTTGFLIVYIVGNLIRDYPTEEIWMYTYLMGIPLLYYDYIRWRNDLDKAIKIADEAEKQGIDLAEVEDKAGSDDTADNEECPRALTANSSISHLSISRV